MRLLPEQSWRHLDRVGFPQPDLGMEQPVKKETPVRSPFFSQKLAFQMEFITASSGARRLL